MTRDIDGGWAWVILVCGFGSLLLNGFLCYSMGMITEAMLEVFEGELSLTSTVGSAVVGAQCCIGPLAGFLSKRVGCRASTIFGGIIATIGLAGASVSKDLYTVLIFGIITGIGYGFPLTSCSIIVGLYFRRLRSLAAGVAMMGGGFGMFVGSPLVRYLIDEYGLHGTFLIMAGISSHFCVIGCLLRPLPTHGTYLEKRADMVPKNKNCQIRSVFMTLKNKICRCDKCSFHVLSNVGFMIYLCSIFLWNVGESACLIHLPNYCMQQGSSKQDSALLYTAMGIGNIVSKLFTGFAANDENVNCIILHVGQLGIAGVLTGLFPLYSRTYGGQLAYAAALGIYTSGVNSLFNPIIVHLVGIEDIAVGFGLVNMFIGFGWLSGSPIAGAIVDFGASYRESYLFSGSMYLLASLSAMLIPLFHSSKDDHVIPRISSLQDSTITIDATSKDRMDEMITDLHVDQTDNRNESECEQELLQTIM